MPSTPPHVNLKINTKYDEEKSDPKNQVFQFSYQVEIKNLGNEPFQLVARRWFITDANQKVQEAYGEGVVGKKPVINPHQSFDYESTVVINTPVGSMRGTYYLLDGEQKKCEFVIPTFTLAVPNMLH